MKKILILGAGRSTQKLIDYLLEKSSEFEWNVLIADINLESSKRAIKNHPNGKAVLLNIEDTNECTLLIKECDLIISMLPAILHDKIADFCLEFGKNLLTASYISDHIKTLSEKVNKAGLLFMCEMGLDPGIDHMSAMHVLNNIRGQGGLIKSFKSFCGGLISKSADNNPWHYKVTWNPRNVVLAGKGVARYKEDNIYKFIPYHRLFKEHKTIKIDSIIYDAYPNRDSLNYIKEYELEHVETMIRGTLRVAGFCDIWQNLIDLGYTEDSYRLPFDDLDSWNTVTRAFINAKIDEDIFGATCRYLNIAQDSQQAEALMWLGIFSDSKLPLSQGSPADLLQWLLINKMSMKEADKDLVVMHHEVDYLLNDRIYKHTSSLNIEGENIHSTAMSKCVGLPLAIMAELLLTDQMKITGVQIPIMSQLYNPILDRLETLGIRFNHKTELIT